MDAELDVLPFACANDATTRRRLILSLASGGRHAEVVYQCAVALAAEPHDGELLFSLGCALSGLQLVSDARSALTRAVALEPRHAAAWLSLGNACADLDEFAEAERHCRAAIRRDPLMAEAHASLGHALLAQGRLTEATAACEAAVRISPNLAEAHWNLAIALLSSGDLPRGFREHEWRKRHRLYCGDFPPLPGPRWDGGDPAGRVILVRAEQGFGDTIQFARYLALIAQRGGTPLLRCDGRLVPLLASMEGVVVLPNAAHVEGYDCWTDQMSLPLLFGTDLTTVPMAAGYLGADADRVAVWRGWLPVGPRIGVVWGGNPLKPNDRRRSVPPAALARLLAVPGVSFVNLQVGERAKQVALPDWSEKLTDFAETAAAIANLDLVVTVDTAVAHLAGALGVPTWVLLAHAPDWRWLRDRVDSPWYESVRLFRQEVEGEWDAMISRLAAELSGWVQNRSSP